MTASRAAATDPPVPVAGPDTTLEPGAVPGTAAGWRASLRSALGGPWTAPVTVVLGSLAIILAGTLPVWGTRLIAPQYPKGLELWFYGGRVTGPVREVNGLNHYIGMQPIDLARVPELQLWPLAIIGAIAVLAVGVLWKGWLGRLALLALWLVPVIVLIDIQRWLMVFGTELDPASALRLDPFVPFVVGPSQVWNFTVWTYPGLALVLIWIVALVATIVRRFAGPPAVPRVGVLAGALALGVVGTIVVVMPSAMDSSAAAAAEHPDGHSTDGGSEALPLGPVELRLLLAATPDGGTLVVPPGRYRANVTIDRPMSVIAGGEVLLDGGGSGSVVTIAADDVLLQGFRIANTGGQVEEGAAIKVAGAARVRLQDNRIEGFYTGIAAEAATELRIEGNTLSGSGQVTHGAGHATDAAAVPAQDQATAADAEAVDHAALGHSGHEVAVADPHAGHGVGDGPGAQGDAISLWATDGVVIRDNVVHAVRDGVYLNYADRVVVDGNEIHHSRYAVHSMFGNAHTIFGNDIRENLSGLVLMYTSGVQAGRNLIADQRSAGTGFGIVVKDVAGLHLAENVIVRNRTGLRAEGTARTSAAEAAVLRNRFESNQAALSLSASSDLGFGANVFKGNLVDLQALEPGVERRNDWTYQGTGNTWGAYRGYDLDRDGVGDVPHTAGGAQQILLTAAPALQAYLTSPAMQLLDAAQELWEAGRPSVIRDSAPRLTEHAPAAPDDRPTPQLAPWLLVGSLLVGGATAVLAAPRPRARSRAIEGGTRP